MERVYEGAGRWRGYMRVWDGGEGVWGCGRVERVYKGI